MMRRWACVGLCVVCAVMGVWAQPAPEVVARFESVELTPLTGQPFEVELVVDVPDGLSLTDWPVIADPWGDFEVVQVGERTQQPNGGGLTVRQIFVMRLWRPGDVVTPETFVSYGVGGADVRRVPVRPLFISVPRVVDPLAQELRPARGVIAPDWRPWLLGGGLMAGIAVGVVVWRLRRTPVPAERPLSPHQQAVERLSGLLRADALGEARLREALEAVNPLRATGDLGEDGLALVRLGEDVLYGGRTVTDDQARAFVRQMMAILRREAGA